jgi:D-cysteine desulfhydrase
MDIEILKNIPHLNHSIIPTPIYRLKNLSKSYSADIFCMRDDITGFAFGGNKTRKLDYLVYDAKAKGADTLLAVGSNQSNFCRIAAAYGAAEGMEVHLLLSGEKQDNPTGNLLLDYLFNAEISFTSSTGNSEIEQESTEIEKELTKRGKKVYRMPMGGSTPVGVLGYIKAFYEIIDYEYKNDIRFDYIFVASGSGGTQAGLVLGKSISGWNGQITGISVGRSSQELNTVINNLVKETGIFLKIEDIDPSIEVNDEYIGEAYGKLTKAGTDAIKDFAIHEGIILDNVYTGKAAAGMLDYIKKNIIKQGSKILFIHTGGNIELFE